jgi:hypothetical protein
MAGNYGFTLAKRQGENGFFQSKTVQKRVSASFDR